MNWSSSSWGRANLAAALVLLAGVAATDHFTGTEYRVYPLYFVPIALAGARTRSPHWLLPLLATLCWAFANWMPPVAPERTQVWLFNAVAQGVAFVTVGLLIRRLHGALLAERLLSRQDPLTQLANTRSFYDTGEKLIAGAARRGQPVTLAYLDLDHFKHVNDTHGHEAGDAVLVRVGRLLKSRLRSSDLAARLGGDEFAILLPDTDLEGATGLLQEVQSQLHEEMRRMGYPVTASVGAVAYPRAPATLEEAIRGADARMYEVKRSGRASVRVLEGR